MAHFPTPTEVVKKREEILDQNCAQHISKIKLYLMGYHPTTGPIKLSENELPRTETAEYQYIKRSLFDCNWSLDPVYAQNQGDFLHYEIKPIGPVSMFGSNGYG